MAIVKCELGGAHSACDKCLAVNVDTTYISPPHELTTAGTHHQIMLCTPCYIETFPYSRYNQETSTNEH